MTRHPEPASPSRTAIIAAVTLVVGGMLSLWMGVAGALTFTRLLLAFAAGAAVGWLIERFTLGASVRLVGTIFASGNIEPPPTYPVAETHIVRGKFAEAAEFFRNHLKAHPEDFEARLRLADLSAAHLQRYDDAERLYREVRDAKAHPRQELAAYNGLIDLHTRMNRLDRLTVELARFADRYRDSALATRARERLRELKAER